MFSWTVAARATQQLYLVPISNLYFDAQDAPDFAFLPRKTPVEHQTSSHPSFKPSTTISLLTEDLPNALQPRNKRRLFLALRGDLSEPKTPSTWPACAPVSPHQCGDKKATKAKKATPLAALLTHHPRPAHLPHHRVTSPSIHPREHSCLIGDGPVAGLGRWNTLLSAQT